MFVSAPLALAVSLLGFAHWCIPSLQSLYLNKADLPRADIPHHDSGMLIRNISLQDSVKYVQSAYLNQRQASREEPEDCLLNGK